MVSKYTRINKELANTRMVELGLNTNTLSHKLVVSRTTVQRWLEGRIKQVRMEHAKALYEVLGISDPLPASRLRDRPNLRVLSRTRSLEELYGLGSSTRQESSGRLSRAGKPDAAYQPGEF